MNDLNSMIDVSRQFKTPSEQLQASIEQDNLSKAAFALEQMRRMPKEQVVPEEPPRIPSLGSLAIPS
jgi:hypothetical protein